MKKVQHIILIISLCFLFHCETLAQYNASDFELTLKADILDKFNEAAKVIYNPNNITTGDSIYNIGIAAQDTSEILAGLILKSFPYSLLRKNEEAQESTNEILSYTYEPKYNFARFVAYQLQIRALVSDNDYLGSMLKAQEMSRDAISRRHIIGINMSYYSMGLVLMLRNNPQLAITYFQQCEDLSANLKLPDKLTWPVFIEMTRAYYILERYDEAEKYSIKAEETANNCGDTFIANRARATRLLTRHQSVSREQYLQEIDSYKSDPYIFKALSRDELLMIKSQYQIRNNNLELALATSDSISSELESITNKESLYRYAGDIKRAYKCRLKRDELKDSLQMIIQTDDIAALDGEMNNESLRLLAEELGSQNKKTIQICAIIVIILLLFSYIYISVHKRRLLTIEKKQLQREVNKQTIKLQELVDVIKQKNNDITDSIKYAQRIQKAILPDLTQYIGHGIKGVFTYFKPYNIVSGDFYWANKKGNKMMIACSDCTGHGVPGGFMSMMGSTLLSDITESHPDYTAGEILKELDNQLITLLGQNSDNDGLVSEGMDLAIIIYDTEKKEINCSAARRPIYVTHENELVEINGVKRSIGERDEVSRRLEFTNQTIKISEGDTVYLYTDGITDQFGGQQMYGENGKRLSKAGVRKLLKDISKFNMEDQNVAFKEALEKWQGTCNQIDDMTFIGINF